MRGKDFLENFELIDQKFIEEAEEKKTKKNIKIPILIAACFMIVLLVAALPFFRKETPPQVGSMVDTTERPQITYTPSPVYDGIPYSELDISDTGFDPALGDVKGFVSLDPVPFQEKYVADCIAVVEGRIKDVRTKHYEFATDYDKFRDGGKTIYRWDTVIYEIEVEKIYKGELGTETLIIEEGVFLGSIFCLKEDHRYVIPVIQTSDDVSGGLYQGNIIEGSNKKESSYCSLYSGEAPIEITEDGYYLFSDIWTTLAACEESVTVTMDIPYDADYAYYNNKMMLIDSVNFEKLFEEILAKYSK